MSLPFVSVQVLALDGRNDLERLLPTLEALDYPAGAFEIVVVDNGSHDDTVAWLRRSHPSVRVVAHGQNLGFARGYNASLRATSAPWFALLNTDTVVDRAWLRELVETAGRHGCAAVGSLMLDWEGRTIDFGGGVVSLLGHAWQARHGAPADAAPRDDEEIPFACAGAMLIRRDAFEQVGGFDDDYFAYFEDVDLGWRMRIAGHRIVLAPRSIVRHRVHGTSSRVAYAQRLRLYERNALFSVYKNLGDDALARVLPVALALTLARGLRASSLPPDAFVLGRPAPETVPLSPRTVATLLAIEDFGHALPALAAKRRRVQALRRVPDAEVFATFGDPLRMHDHGAEYESTARALIELFGLEELVTPPGPGFRPAASAASKGTVVAPGMPPAPAPGTVHQGPQPHAPSTEHPAPGTFPSISVIVLTMLGPTHLPDVLDSIVAQVYPADRVEIIVVDNHSAEDPAEVIRRHAPRARHVRMDANVGFCAGNNAGVSAATGEYVFILNDDTRLAPGCLAALVQTARRRGAASVGARILSWTGERIDFAGGGMNFYGKGFQTDVGSPDLARHADERPLLFACGAAVLIERRLFEEAGGFNPELFVYYEDLALGWQVWLRGGEVWLCPGAVVYHRHHGTTGEWPKPMVLRLYERNALMIITEQFELETLARTLPAALVLAVERALILSGLSAMPQEWKIPQTWWLRRLWWRLKPSALYAQVKADLANRGAGFRLGPIGSLRAVGLRGLAASAWQLGVFVAGDVQEQLDRRWAYFVERGLQPREFDARIEVASGRGGAILTGLAEYLQNLPARLVRRRGIEAARRRGDAEIFGRFGEHWLSPTVTGLQRQYEMLERQLCDSLGIAALADAWRSSPDRDERRRG